MRTTESEEQQARLRTSAPSAHIVDFSFSALSPAEARLVQRLPSRYAIGPDGSLVYKVKPPLRSSVSMTGGTAKRPRTKKLKGSMARQRWPSPRTCRQPAQSTSWHRFTRSGLFIATLVFIAVVTMLCAYRHYMPSSRSPASAADNITTNNPIEAETGDAFGPAMALSTSCDGTEAGCQGSTTDTAEPLSPEPEEPQVFESMSLGNDFFDCLNDLRIAREQKATAAYWIKLGPSIMQWEHLLENPERLSKNIKAQRRDIVLNTNAARVAGSGSVKKIVNEFENARLLDISGLPRAELQQELSEGLDSVQASLQKTTDYTIASAQAVKSSEEIADRVVEQAYQELSLLRVINKANEKWVETEVGDWWTGRSVKRTQPDLDGFEKDRRLAGRDLKTLIKTFERGAETHLSMAMVLGQCAANTESFSEQVQKAFSFNRYSASISSQIQYLSPHVEQLSISFTELRKSDASLVVP